jgi:hypothetical protein
VEEVDEASAFFASSADTLLAQKRA